MLRPMLWLRLRRMSGTCRRRAWCCREAVRSMSTSAERIHFPSPPGSSFPPTFRAATISPSRLPSSTTTTALSPICCWAMERAIPSSCLQNGVTESVDSIVPGGSYSARHSCPERALHRPRAGAADAAAVSVDASLRPRARTGLVADQRQRLYRQPAGDLQPGDALAGHASDRHHLRTVHLPVHAAAVHATSRRYCRRWRSSTTSVRARRQPGKTDTLLNASQFYRAVVFYRRAGDARGQRCGTQMGTVHRSLSGRRLGHRLVRLRHFSSAVERQSRHWTGHHRWQGSHGHVQQFLRGLLRSCPSPDAAWQTGRLIILETEPINPLYTGQYAVGPYTANDCGAVRLQFVTGRRTLLQLSAGLHAIFTISDSASTCSPGTTEPKLRRPPWPRRAGGPGCSADTATRPGRR